MTIATAETKAKAQRKSRVVPPPETLRVAFRSEAMLRCQQEVKTNSPVYLHHRVYLGLARLLRDGVLTGGEWLPSCAQLAQFLHVSSPTVTAAINRLALEGLVVTLPGRGTLVLRSTP